MNSGIATAIEAVEQELVALDEGYARDKGDLESTLAHLQRIGAKQDGATAPSTTRKKKALKTTDRQTDRARRMPARRSLPEDLKDVGARIVAALKATCPQKPGELAVRAKVKLEPYAYRALLVNLAEAGQIVRGGNGRGAFVTSPGKQPAKEGP